MKRYLFLFVIIVFVSITCLFWLNNETNAYNDFNKQISVVDFEMKAAVKLTGATPKIIVKIAIPQDLPNIQTISDLKYYPNPAKVYINGGTKYAEYLILNPKSDFNLIVRGRATLYKFDLTKAMANKTNKPYDTDLNLFLKPEKFIESNDPLIIQTASTIKNMTDVEMVAYIYKYVIDNMHYDKYNPKDVGAKNALLRKQGDCSEYSDLMVALCRAKNIPARVVTGYTSYTYSAIDTPKHAWVEAYLKGIGWVPFDPTLGDENIAAFNNLEPKYIYLSNKRNDPLLDYYYYMSYKYWGAPIKFDDLFTAKILK
ncbi:MAG: transglutaminase family protein [Vampirovibrionia bacterium]